MWVLIMGKDLNNNNRKKMLLAYIIELGSSDLVAVPGVDLSTQSSFSSTAFLFIYLFFSLEAYGGHVQ